MAKITFPVPSEPVAASDVMTPNFYRQFKRLFEAWNAIADFAVVRQRGTFTVTGTATTAVVTLSPALSAATYTVTAIPVSFTGAPLASSFTIASIAKTTSRFTVTLMTAPGVGTSITYNYSVIL